METFVVKVPFIGFYEVLVEAETKKEAEQKASEVEVDLTDSDTFDNYEWEAHKIIIDEYMGHVLHNKIESWKVK